MKRCLLIALSLMLIGAGALYWQRESLQTPAGTVADELPIALYSIAHRHGRELQEQLATLQQHGVAIDDDVLWQAFQDGWHGEAQYRDEEMHRAMRALQARLKDWAQQERDSVTNANRQLGRSFLSNFDRDGGVVKTASGLRYKVLRPGDGDTKARAGDTVLVNYRGTLIDGTEFDSNARSGRPVEFAFDNVIPGWAEALALMSKGAQYQLAVPAHLAYGRKGLPGSVPPNAVLLFELELVEVRTEQRG